VPTIAFVSSKGGVGKTTSALLLGLGLAQRGAAVVLVDSDPNLPLTRWAELPGRPAGITVVQAPSFADLPGALRSARRNGDWVIVDTEGGAPRMAGWAISEADMVIVPLAASALEVREVLKIGQLVGEVEQRRRRPILLACLFARTPAPLRRSFRDVSRLLMDEGLPILPTVLIDKEAFRALFASGGELEGLNRRRVPGVASAQVMVGAYTTDVLTFLGEGAPGA
jgi:chromosome partitioning protein